MAKTKTYPTNALTKAARTTQTVVLRELRKAGIRPLQELEAGKQTYRSFGQEAMDYIVAWRAAKDSPIQETTPAQDVLPAPAMAGSDPVAKLISRLGVMADTLATVRDAQATVRAEADSGMKYLDRKIDQCQVRLARLEQTLDSVAAMVKALHDELCGSTVALVEAARGPADDAGLTGQTREDNEHDH
jgi:hypothetical protein